MLPAYNPRPAAHDAWPASLLATQGPPRPHCRAGRSCKQIKFFIPIHIVILQNFHKLHCALFLVCCLNYFFQLCFLSLNLVISTLCFIWNTLAYSNTRD
uniref:Uncharacterized protein n=1 Tax=Arundo donax TaxID=35708 RepID=A0A0A8ZPH4_ARUDO